MNETILSISLEAWLERAAKVKTATRELVKLWLINDLGCQRDLANHLGLTDRAIRKHVAKLRELGELPQVEETDGRAIRNRQAATATDRNLVPTSVMPPVVSLSDFRHSSPDEAANEADLAFLRAENEALKAENEALRQQLHGNANDEEPSQDGCITSMGTKQGRAVEKDWEQFQHYLESIRELHGRNFRPDSTGLTESHWRELSQEYESLKYFADIRWEELRSDLQKSSSDLIQAASNLASNAEVVERCNQMLAESEAA